MVDGRRGCTLHSEAVWYLPSLCSPLSGVFLMAESLWCLSHKQEDPSRSLKSPVHIRYSGARVNNPRVEEAETRGSLELAGSQSGQKACSQFLEKTCLITLGGE